MASNTFVLNLLVFCENYYIHWLLCTDVIGAASDCLSQFNSLRSILLGSYAVAHHKNGLGDAVHHGNDSC